jgi:hypothetical protein
MRRGTTAALAAMMLGAMLILSRASGTADASEWWCWDDPVLVVNGQVLHVYSGVSSNATHRVTMAEMVITIPNGVDAKVTASNAPRFPQNARLVRSGSVNADGSVTVSATTTVHGHGRFDAAIKISHPSGGESVSYGESNQPISTSYTLMPKKAEAKAAPATSNRK